MKTVPNPPPRTRSPRFQLWKLAAIVAAASAVPVVLLEDRAPWIAIIPILVGTIIVLAFNPRLLLPPVRQEDRQPRNVSATTVDSSCTVAAPSAIVVARPAVYRELAATAAMIVVQGSFEMGRVAAAHRSGKATRSVTARVVSEPGPPEVAMSPSGSAHEQFTTVA